MSVATGTNSAKRMLLIGALSVLLLDIFAYGLKFEPYFQRAQEALAKFRTSQPGAKPQ